MSNLTVVGLTIIQSRKAIVAQSVGNRDMMCVCVGGGLLLTRKIMDSK